SRFAVFIATVQFILLLGHLFVYETWRYFSPLPGVAATAFVRATLLLLSISFVAASLLAARFYNRFVRLFYTIASIWLGTLNFLFLGSLLCWVFYALFRLSGTHVDRSGMFNVLIGGALVLSLYGFANASWVRVRRITVKLPG